MSEKAPQSSNQEIADIVTVDKSGKGHRPDGKFLSQQNMDVIAAHQDKIRDSLAEYKSAGISDQSEQQEDSSATYSIEGANLFNGGRDDLNIRPVRDGEYGDDYLTRSENADPEDPDYLPIGAMAHEPWTFDTEAATTSTSGDDQRENEGSTSIVHVEENDEDRPSDWHPEYDGPVEPGSEIELAPKPGALVPVEKPGELVQLPEVDPAMIERLDVARSRYAEMTAKSRKSYLGRFFRPDTQVGGILAKIPGVTKIVEKWNTVKASKPVQGLANKLSSTRAFNAETEQAKQEYEEAYTALSEATAAELQRVGWEEDVVRQLSLIGNIAQDGKLEDEILHQRQAQGKSTNKFVNWWVSQQGFKGKLKKAGVVLAAGAVTGLTGGIFAGATAAYVTGGAAGFGMAKHVTARRANGVNKANGLTVAAEQSLEDRAVKAADIQAAHAIDGKGSVEDITSATEASTDKEMMRNRKRVRTATALGAMAGKGAFKLKEALRKDPAPDTPKDVPKEPTPPKQPTPEAPKPPTPEAPKGLQFEVEPGSGYERELRQFFEANGHSISGQHAHDLYKTLETQLGPDNIIRPMGSYARTAGDYGISAPGSAEWTPEAQEVLKYLLSGM
ncbi:MAG: hypothetical protein U0520_01645 [Candidatus Saccharimonadales bacterium]